VTGGSDLTGKVGRVGRVGFPGFPDRVGHGLDGAGQDGSSTVFFSNFFCPRPC
jgi:hypothetical protein